MLLNQCLLKGKSCICLPQPCRQINKKRICAGSIGAMPENEILLWVDICLLTKKEKYVTL